MIKNFAADVAVEVKSAGFGFDPTIVIGLIAAITAIVQMLKNCNLTPAQAAKRAKERRLLDRLIIRQQFKKVGLKTKFIDPAVASIVDKASALTTAQMKEAYNETGLADD